MDLNDIGFGDWMESEYVSDFKHSNYTYLVIRSYSPDPIEFYLSTSETCEPGHEIESTR